MVMSICQLGLFVEFVLVGTSLILNDSVDGVENLLVGFSVARAVTVKNFIADYHKWYAAHVLIQEFTEILHKGLIILVTPDLERIDINFVFGFSW